MSDPPRARGVPLTLTADPEFRDCNPKLLAGLDGAARLLPTDDGCDILNIESFKHVQKTKTYHCNNNNTARGLEPATLAATLALERVDRREGVPLSDMVLRCHL